MGVVVGWPPQPLRPQEHMSKWGGDSLSLISPTPHSTKQRRSPFPRATPHPDMGCTFSGSQQSYGSGGHE